MSNVNAIKKSNGKDRYTEAAAEHFGIKYEDVTPKQRAFAKAQAYAESYGFMGVPKREYQVSESGNVEFVVPILSNEELVLLH